MAKPRTPKGRAVEVARRLAIAYPDAECELDHTNAFELLAATILSAQTTDVRVNMVTPVLFRRYPTPADLAANGIISPSSKPVKTPRSISRSTKAAIRIVTGSSRT